MSVITADAAACQKIAALRCSHPGCTRTWIRVRAGERFCLFHPDRQPPTQQDLDEARATAYRREQRARAARRATG